MSTQDTAARSALAARRDDLAAQAATLARDLAGIMDAAALDATDDEHDPEGTTIAFERAQAAALLERTRARVTELDRALARLDEGSYGRCERCGQRIPAARLAARPDARTCVDCASLRRGTPPAARPARRAPGGSRPAAGGTR